MKTSFSSFVRTLPIVVALAASAARRLRPRAAAARGWHGGGGWHGVAGWHGGHYHGGHGGYYWPGAFWAASAWASASAPSATTAAITAATTRRTTVVITTTRCSLRRLQQRGPRCPACRAAGAAGDGAGRADLLSEERPERRSDRGRSPRVQPLGNDAARCDGRCQHLPARDLRVHGRARLHRPVGARRGTAARRARVTDCACSGAARRKAARHASDAGITRVRRRALQGRDAIRRQCTGPGSGNERDEARGTVREDLSSRLSPGRCRHRLRARHRRVDSPLRRPACSPSTRRQRPTT